MPNESFIAAARRVYELPKAGRIGRPKAMGNPRQPMHITIEEIRRDVREILEIVLTFKSKSSTNPQDRRVTTIVTLQFHP